MSPQHLTSHSATSRCLAQVSPLPETPIPATPTPSHIPSHKRPAPSQSPIPSQHAAEPNPRPTPHEPEKCARTWAYAMDVFYETRPRVGLCLWVEQARWASAVRSGRARLTPGVPWRSDQTWELSPANNQCALQPSAWSIMVRPGTGKLHLNTNTPEIPPENSPHAFQS